MNEQHEQNVAAYYDACEQGGQDIAEMAKAMLAKIRTHRAWLEARCQHFGGSDYERHMGDLAAQEASFENVLEQIRFDLSDHISAARIDAARRKVQQP